MPTWFSGSSRQYVYSVRRASWFFDQHHRILQQDQYGAVHLVGSHASSISVLVPGGFQSNLLLSGDELGCVRAWRIASAHSVTPLTDEGSSLSSSSQCGAMLAWEIQLDQPVLGACFGGLQDEFILILCTDQVHCYRRSFMASYTASSTTSYANYPALLSTTFSLEDLGPRGSRLFLQGRGFRHIIAVPGRLDRFVALSDTELVFLALCPDTNTLELLSRRSGDLSLYGDFVALAPVHSAQLVAVLCRFSKVLFLDSDGVLVRLLKGSPDGECTAIASSQRDWLFVGTVSGRVQCYDLRDLQCRSVVEPPAAGCGRVLLLRSSSSSSGIGSELVVGYENGLVSTLSIPAQFRLLRLHMAHRPGNRIVQVCPDLQHPQRCYTLSSKDGQLLCHMAEREGGLLQTRKIDVAALLFQRFAGRYDLMAEEGDTGSSRWVPTAVCARDEEGSLWMGDSWGFVREMKVPSAGNSTTTTSATLSRMLNSSSSVVVSSGSSIPAALGVIESDHSAVLGLVCSSATFADGTLYGRPSSSSRRYLMVCHVNRQVYVYDTACGYAECLQLTIRHPSWEWVMPQFLNRKSSASLASGKNEWAVIAAVNLQSIEINSLNNPALAGTVSLSKTTTTAAAKTKTQCKASGPITGLVVHPSQLFFFVSTTNGTIEVFDATSCTRRGGWRIVPTARLCDIDPSGLYLVLTDLDPTHQGGRIIFYEALTGNYVSSFSVPDCGEPLAQWVKFSASDGHLIWAAGRDGVVLCEALPREMANSMEQVKRRMTRVGQQQFWENLCLVFPNDLGPYAIDWNNDVDEVEDEEEAQLRMLASRKQLEGTTSPAVKQFSPAAQRRKQQQLHASGKNRSAMTMDSFSSPPSSPRDHGYSPERRTPGDAACGTDPLLASFLERELQERQDEKNTETTPREPTKQFEQEDQDDRSSTKSLKSSSSSSKTSASKQPTGRRDRSARNSQLLSQSPRSSRSNIDSAHDKRDDHNHDETVDSYRELSPSSERSETKPMDQVQEEEEYMEDDSLMQEQQDFAQGRGDDGGEDTDDDDVDPKAAPADAEGNAEAIAGLVAEQRRQERERERKETLCGIDNFEKRLGLSKDAKTNKSKALPAVVAPAAEKREPASSTSTEETLEKFCENLIHEMVDKEFVTVEQIMHRLVVDMIDAAVLPPQL